MDEFDLIECFFTPQSARSADVVFGIGDDAAILSVPAGHEIVVTTDTQNEGVHFPGRADPAAIAYRSCVTAVSDIAAMGACPRWASIALSLPRAEPDWLRGFAAGAAAALRDTGAGLVGGDTTSGPLSITWNIIGTVPSGAALRRDGARVGDALYVSGTLGSAGAALALLDAEPGSRPGAAGAILERYWKPQARIELGKLLRDFASSCVDVSDGLVADAGHLSRASGCGFTVWRELVPLMPELADLVGRGQALDLALTGGDDYELCFTVPGSREKALVEAASAAETRITRIGEACAGRGVRVVDAAGREVRIEKAGYSHF